MSKALPWPGHLVLIVVLAQGAASHARGQTPTGPESLANSSDTEGAQYLLDLACNKKSSECALFWVSAKVDEGPPLEVHDYLYATSLSPLGEVESEVLLRTDDHVGGFAVVARGPQWALFWDKRPEGTDHGHHPVMQLFDGSFAPRSEIKVLEYPGAGCPSIGPCGRTLGASVAAGGFGALFHGLDVDSSDGAFLLLLDQSGGEIGPAIQVGDVPAGDQTAFSLTSAAKSDGAITVAFQELPEDDEAGDTEVFVRRFSSLGEPLSSSLQVNEFTEGPQRVARVAGSGAGDSVLVWESDGQDGSFSGVFGRRITGDGSAAGPEFQVNQSFLSDQGGPAVAMDPGGNFLVAWQTFDPEPGSAFFWDIRARLYRADGEPVGPEIRVNQERLNYQTGARVSHAGKGQFVVAWESFAQVEPVGESNEDVFFRRLSASPGDELCIVSRSLLRCDTGRSGGNLEIAHVFGSASGGPALLGDIDGDGRDDPCEFRNGAFRCDTDHEGGKAEVQVFFNREGIPLLGDIDGDGRGDPCFFSDRRFWCDTDHDGGFAETVVRFGGAGELPLLGDIDGDGRDDPCVFSAGVFRCDAAHDGGKTEANITFGKKGDQALLGDYDGDGRDDPCLYRAGKLRCDTAHDGGAAEAILAIGADGDRVVLGNLDGL